MKTLPIVFALVAVLAVSGCATTGQVVKEGCEHDWVSVQPPVTSLVRVGTEANAMQEAERVCQAICLSRAEVKTSKLLDPVFVGGEKYVQCQCDLNDCYT